MQASVSQARRGAGDLPNYSEIHVDQEVSITSRASRPTAAAPRRPTTYSYTPTIYSASHSSSSEYSQSNHEQESPATSIDRSSEPMSETTMANLDSLLMSRNTSVRMAKNPRGVTDRMAHEELLEFLRACTPPPDKSMSLPEDASRNGDGKGSFKIFARKKSTRRRKPSSRLLRLPESAVVATTSEGHKHIAIEIQQVDHSELLSQYKYHAAVKESRKDALPKKAPPGVASSSKTTSRNVSTSSSAKTGSVAVKRPVLEPAIPRYPDRNSSVRVNVEHGPWIAELPTVNQSVSLAARSRPDSVGLQTIGTDNARVIQKFWDAEHGVSSSNVMLRGGGQGSPGRQSEMTDPRHSGGTAYSERTLHSRESSGGSTRQLLGPKLVAIGPHPVRTSSKAKDSVPRPITPRQFALRPSNGTTIPSGTHNGGSDLITLSGFLGSPSSRVPPQPAPPGPAPNRKLPGLPEGSEDSQKGASKNGKSQPKADMPVLPRQTSRSRAAFERAFIGKEIAISPSDHPANRSVSTPLTRQDSLRTAHHARQERVRAKKQRDINLLKGSNIARPNSARTATGDGTQPHTVGKASPPPPGNGASTRGSVREARKRSENLRPAPLDFSKIPTFRPPATDAGDEQPQTSRSLPAPSMRIEPMIEERPQTSGRESGDGLPASSFGSGNGKGSVRNARKRSEGLMSPLALVESSSTNSSMHRNPSLRAAANALTSIMMEAEANPRPPLPSSTPSQGSKLVNVFPQPPRSARSSPRRMMSPHETQTPPRSPSPSLQSSDEEGGGHVRGVGVCSSLKVPLRSQTATPKKSSSAARTNSSSVLPATPSLARPSSRGQTRSASASAFTPQTSRSTQPLPSLHGPNPASAQPLEPNAGLTAAIRAFELHRHNRRQERNRMLRERRARELAMAKEREIFALRLNKGEERQEAVEERLRAIEEGCKELAGRYDLVVRIAGEIEAVRGAVRGLEAQRQFALMPGRVGSVNEVEEEEEERCEEEEEEEEGDEGEDRRPTPVPGNMTSRGMRIDKSMPPSSSGNSPTPAPIPSYKSLSTVYSASASASARARTPTPRALTPSIHTASSSKSPEPLRSLTPGSHRGPTPRYSSLSSMAPPLLQRPGSRARGATNGSGSGSTSHTHTTTSSSSSSASTSRSRTPLPHHHVPFAPPYHSFDDTSESEADLASDSEDEQLPEYSGRGEADVLGGSSIGRSNTPIGSLIEELSSAGINAQTKSGSRVGGRSVVTARGVVVNSSQGLRSSVRSGEVEERRSNGNGTKSGDVDDDIKSISQSSKKSVGKRKGRGSRDGDVGYEGSGVYGGWNPHDSVSTVAVVEGGLVASDLD